MLKEAQQPVRFTCPTTGRHAHATPLTTVRDQQGRPIALWVRCPCCDARGLPQGHHDYEPNYPQVHTLLLTR
jgi:hypothetical protein